MPPSAPPGATPVLTALLDRLTHLADTGRRITVSGLCAAAGISRTTWYALRDPDHRPIRGTVTALAAALDLDPVPLLRLAGYGTPTTPNPQPDTTGPTGS